MINKIRMLKVKIKSLAAEAEIIRKEEGRSRTDMRMSLCEHRRGVVRYEARHSLLAYAFLRGRTYAETEPNCCRPFDVDKVRRMVHGFGAVRDEDESQEDFQERKNTEAIRFQGWVKDAARHQASVSQRIAA